MTNLELTSINSPPPPSFENLIQVRYGVYRRWKLTALILVVITLLTIATVNIIIFRQTQSDISITTITDNLTQVTWKTLIITSTRLPGPVSTPNKSISWCTPIESKNSSGLPLSHTLYYNLVDSNSIQGYVTNVSLRLFTNWEGEHPLYIYGMLPFSFSHIEILHRYPISPARNNTQWQTILIPPGEFPINIGNYVGVGMQDQSDKNLISAALTTYAIYETNITNMTNRISLQYTKISCGAAFVYAVASNLS